MSEVLVYGASGYTGRLIAAEAARRGLRPVVAGRSASRIAPLAAELGVPYRVFDLDDPARAAAQLPAGGIVLHCAGPFSATGAPMLEACLAAGAHYLDITGEIEVFEHAFAQHERAERAGVVVCPGVGFDVVPTDCLAAALKEALPDATHLALGFSMSGGPSPGTLKTMLEGAPSGGRARVDGRIVTVPQGGAVRRIDFGAGPESAVGIPWGDVSTAYRTTGIPNIECFIAVPGWAVRGIRAAGRLGPLLAWPGVQRGAGWLVDRTVKGPDAARQARERVRVWGEVVNAAGERRTARIETTGAYRLTVEAALAVLEHVPAAAPGACTPAGLAGSGLVTRLPGSGPLTLD